MQRQNLIRYCDAAIKFSLYLVAFYIPISIALIESFAGLAIAAWLLKKIIAREGLQTAFKNNFLTLPVLFYFFICAASSFLSSNPAISFRHLIFKTLEYLLIFFIAAEAAADKKFLRNISVVLAVSAGLVGVDGIYQHFTHRDFLRGRGLVIRSRINGPFAEPTDFANYLASLLPLVGALCFLKFRKFWVKPALVILPAVIFLSVILSASRSAWIALILAVPFAGVFLGRKRLLRAAALMLICVLFSLALRSDIVKARVTTLFNKDARADLFRDRPYLLATGYNMLLDRPVLGQGLGTFMHNFAKFKPFVKNNPYGEGPCYAHNCLLQIAAETGLAGLFAFLFIIAALFIASIFSLRKTAVRDGFYYYAFSGLNIGIFTYLIGSIFDTNLYSLPLAMLFWLMLGLAAAAKKTLDK